jgi:anti-sigma factor RsiW
MDHDEAVRQQMTERYLLNELAPQARDEFEEHYFDCQKCAADVHAGALFVEESKVVLQSKEMRSPLPEASTVSPLRRPFLPAGWSGWLRPVFVVPAFALLLAVIGYQDWANRHLQEAANSPQVLASAVVNVNVRGAEPIGVPAQAGHAIELTLNLPPGGSYSAYKLDLYSLQGKLEWSRTIPAAGNDTLSLYIPANSISGNDHGLRTLAVQGITAGGTNDDLGRYRIELQNQK